MTLGGFVRQSIPRKVRETGIKRIITTLTANIPQGLLKRHLA